MILSSNKMRYIQHILHTYCQSNDKKYPFGFVPKMREHKKIRYVAKQQVLLAEPECVAAVTNCCYTWYALLNV